MKKISKCVLYVLTFVLAIAAGSFCLIKSFGIAYEQPQTTSVKVGESTFNTSAKAMVLMEANSGRVLASHNPDEKLPMASLTKIITAIVAIENCEDLDALHAIPKDAQGIEGSSIYLKTGEHLSVRQLLYGLMLRSGNDSAVALAHIIAGDTQKFATMCNEFCQSIGATSTNLENPHGLHSQNHYTTAQDLATISAYALKNDTFAQVVGTQKFQIPNELGKFDHRDLLNKNRFLKMLGGADGIKTGYTKVAGRCFVGSATRESDGMKLVCVLLNCNPMFQECKALIELAQQNYTLTEILPTTGYEASVNVKNSHQMTTLATSKNGFVYPLTKQEENLVEVTNTLKTMYDAPVSTSDILGEVQVFLNKQLIFSDKIYSINNIEDDSYGGSMAKIIENF